ncbi:MAG: SpoVR family protein [Gammaproteobacteria bacterium]|nr:SpoVR family protein [Gammaproteobacteria bacterium]
MKAMHDQLERYTTQLEALARDQGLDYYPVDFELVPASFMTEVAVYGLPVRMPHWSFGVRYIHQYVQHRMGHSRLFEVVFPGNPGRAYLSENNSVEENTLVVAHVLGHADFARNNALFAASQRQVGYDIVDLAAQRAKQIAGFIEAHGVTAVEAVLDAALALEPHIDVNHPLRRPPYPEYVEDAPKGSGDGFHSRFATLPGEAAPAPARQHRRAPVPPHPELDLLWFIANYGGQMEDWERDIFLMVREESFYFHPLFSCQIMNEGWASYWHARLLREADFLPQHLYLEAIKTHSDVVRPYAGDDQTALAINPYHVGFVLWERLVEEQGLEAARRVMSCEDDFGFLRNHLDEALARELRLFRYQARRNGEIAVTAADLDDLVEEILAPRFNFGAPRIAVAELGNDGSLILEHDHRTDGRGLDLERSAKVLEYIQRVWRRPVVLRTVDGDGAERIIESR